MVEKIHTYMSNIKGNLLDLLKEDIEDAYQIYVDMDGVLTDFERRFEQFAGVTPNEFIDQKTIEFGKKKAEEQKKKEMEEKIEMFKKVLEIDPVDQVANFGLGVYLLGNRSIQRRYRTPHHLSRKIQRLFSGLSITRKNSRETIRKQKSY